ncbi:MAG: hypothetical protein R3F20_08935 [Planctomycetota bacterium]
MHPPLSHARRLRPVALTLAVAVLWAGSSVFASGQTISGFECPSVGGSPSCDGWVVTSGVPSVVTAAMITCAGLPTEGTRFCQLPAPGGPSSPAFAGVGNPSAYPYAAGVSQMTRTFVATNSMLEIDYNWSAPPGAPSWFEILLVNPANNAVLAVFAQGDAMTTPLTQPGCGATFGSPPPNATGIQTATATVPAAFIGQSVRVVCVAGENGTIFIPPISFLNVDALRFSATPPLFPGNGADCDVEVSINGVPPTGLAAQGQHDLNFGDSFAFRLSSPGGALDNAGFALIYTPAPTGSLPAPIPLLGAGNPADVWIDPMNAVVVIDTLGPPTSILVPQLVPGGYTFGPFNVPAGLTGISAMVQMFAFAPGFNPVNIGVSNGEELRFL